MIIGSGILTKFFELEFFPRPIVFLSMTFQKNVLLKNYTTFKIGGPAKYFCIVKDKKDLIEAVNFARRTAKLPFFILGGGSNLLVADKGFNGLVIKIENCKLKIPACRQAGKICKVIAGAGVSLAKLVSITANVSLSGMEWAVGIPGATIGGAIRGNAGAFDIEMEDLVKKVEVFNAKDGKIKILENKECHFSYRSSIFKKNPDLIILSCELELKKEKPFGTAQGREKIKEILNYRKEKHPKFPSAGSIFKNPENIRASRPRGRASLSARDLIEKAGLKGKKIGGAQISEQHANFIINMGGAEAKDVLELIDLAKKEVKNKLGIKLEEEIKFLS